VRLMQLGFRSGGTTAREVQFAKKGDRGAFAGLIDKQSAALSDCKGDSVSGL
jgi:hypothetical protein